MGEKITTILSNVNILLQLSPLIIINNHYIVEHQLLAIVCSQAG